MKFGRKKGPAAGTAFTMLPPQHASACLIAWTSNLGCSSKVHSYMLRPPNELTLTALLPTQVANHICRKTTQNRTDSYYLRCQRHFRARWDYGRFITSILFPRRQNHSVSFLLNTCMVFATHAGCLSGRHLPLFALAGAKRQTSNHNLSSALTLVKQNSVIKNTPPMYRGCILQIV